MHGKLFSIGGGGGEKYLGGTCLLRPHVVHYLCGITLAAENCLSYNLSYTQYIFQLKTRYSPVCVRAARSPPVVNVNNLFTYSRFLQNLVVFSCECILV